MRLYVEIWEKKKRRRRIEGLEVGRNRGHVLHTPETPSLLLGKKHNLKGRSHTSVTR